MPIYAYRCDSCGYEKDVLQKLSDAPLSDCPECQAAAFRKQVTAAGFQLKGSGWYATDFKNGSSNGKSSSNSGASAGAEGSKAPSTEATAAPAGGCGAACACH